MDDALPIGTRAVQAPLPATLCCHRLHQLAPQIAERLAAVWGDLSGASRFLEAVLGGEHAPRLADAVIVELVRLYEYLEEFELQRYESGSRAARFPHRG